MAVEALCELGGRFSRCKNPHGHTCQYCGRRFCAQHSYYLRGHDAVCAAKLCAAKHDDLVDHHAYRRRVEQRNLAGLCGVETCGPHPGFECSICHGHFCSAHLENRMYPFSDGRIVIDRPASVCAHCWDRRKLWRRRK